MADDSSSISGSNALEGSGAFQSAFCTAKLSFKYAFVL
jgi:hypothetical protein